MTLLVLGLALFLGIHTFTTLRSSRAVMLARLGEGSYKGLYSVISAAGIALIVIGFARYRSEGYIVVWDPPDFLRPVTLVLMWFSFVALAAAYAPVGRLKSALKHPLLVGVKAWALAHVLANGDLGSILLFGTFLGWAVYDRIALKRRGDAGPPSAPVGIGDGVAVVIGTAAYTLMFWLHPIAFGVPIG
ncbi:MAG: NnrU family protein [Enhydrobacter sp.]|nr:MAG: NnrU family protein [Enhydrobacter sp.]